MIGLGALLVIGAFAGGLRWLALPAVALALGVGVVSAAGIDLGGGVGERDYRPASAAEIRDRYELGMGELVVDLRDAQLPRGDTRLDLRVGLGQALLVVPRDVCVASSAEVGVGQVTVFDRANEGVDLDWEDTRRPGPVAAGWWWTPRWAWATCGSATSATATSTTRTSTARTSTARTSTTRTPTGAARSTATAPSISATTTRAAPATLPAPAAPGAQMRDPDVPSLVAGIAMIGLGAALLLDRLDTIDIRFATFAPIAFAAVGAILLSLGLSRRAD